MRNVQGSTVDIDSIFQRFDLNGTLPSHLAVAPELAPDCGDIIERIEDASAQGDLHAVRAAHLDLQASPAWSFWAKAPGRALIFAIDNQRTPFVEFLLEQGATVGPHHAKIAAFKRNTAILQLLLDHGWNINEQMEWSIPPPMSLAIEDAHLTAWYLSHGADPNARCLLDFTPLSFAVQLATLSVVELLFEHGGSIAYGQLLHYAARRASEDSLEVLNCILDKGAPVNGVMYQDHPVSYAQQSLFGLGTPLHGAAESGNLDVVRMLLDNGADPSVKDSCGQTVLERAERAQRPSVVDYLRPITATASRPSL